MKKFEEIYDMLQCEKELKKHFMNKLAVMKRKEAIKIFIVNMLDYVIDIWGEATEEHKKEIENSLESYVSDWVLGIVKLYNLNFTENEIDSVINVVVYYFEKL